MAPGQRTRANPARARVRAELHLVRRGCLALCRQAATRSARRGTGGHGLYEKNGQPVDDLPDDFYSTHAYTDEMLRMIEEGHDSGRPFVGYLAYTAVHDPLHVPDTDLIDHHLDLYLENNDYNALRAERIDRLVDRGLIDPDVATRWPVQTPDWDTLSPAQRRDLAYRMAVHAAMIDDVDQQIGRLTEHLKETGEYDNTPIVVTSDNGAASASRVVIAHLPGQQTLRSGCLPSSAAPAWQSDTSRCFGALHDPDIRTGAARA